MMAWAQTMDMKLVQENMNSENLSGRNGSRREERKRKRKRGRENK